MILRMKTSKIRQRGLTLLGVIIVLTIMCVGVFWGGNSVEATLDPQDEANFSQNDALFYEPCGDADSNKESVEICGTNKNYADEQVWTDAELKAIKANAPFYQKAASKYGIPWQILAVIHKREHSLARDNPGNGQGVYQFYSAEERSKCEGGDFSPGKISDEQFQIQTDCAAKRIKESYGAGLNLTRDDDIKRMFFKYNGTASAYKRQAIRLGFSQAQAENGEGSPYVMNRYDKKREPSGKWCQIKRDNGPMECPANNDFGAFVYYKAITCGGNSDTDSVLDAADSATSNSEGTDSADTGSGTAESSSDVSCDGNDGGSMNLNASAVALAWPEGTSQNTSYQGGSATEAFNKAHKKFTPGGGDACAAAGASCDMFVATVVRYAGYDKNYPLGAVGAQADYVKKHPDLWQIIDWSDGDKSKVKPGDIIIENGEGHTQLIVQDKDGKIKYASASHCDYYGKIKGFYAPRQPAFIVRATHASNSTEGVSTTKGVTSSSTDGTITPSGQNNGDIASSATALAWPESKYKEHYKTEATEAFTNYYESLPGKDATDCSKGGKDCSSFVNAVLLYAGAKTGGKEKIKDVHSLREELENDSSWEEVKPKENKFKKSDLQSGDVIIYYKKGKSNSTAEDEWNGLNPYHAAIYIDTPDGGRIAQANNCATFGYISKDGMPNGKKNVRVYRWNGQKEVKSNECNVCAGNENEEDGDGSETGLKQGGMTLAEAKKFVKAYHDAAMGKYYKKRGDVRFQGAQIHDAGCPFGPMNNCVAFSQWFINKYTKAGPNWNHTVNGVGMVDKVVSELHFKHGTEPRPYAIFSKAGPSSAGHTGVILGVNKNSQKVVVGEASCSSGRSQLYYEPQAAEYSFSAIKGWEYAYTSGKLKGNLNGD